jgi:hypothetical protein
LRKIHAIVGLADVARSSFSIIDASVIAPGSDNVIQYGWSFDANVDLFVSRFV